MKVLKYFLLSATLLSAENNTTTPQEFETMSVTATKMATKTKEVSQSIAVIDKVKLDQLPMTNINDALQEIPGVLSVSKNGGYDSRVYIRGAGIKATYGIREIMILRDGFPMTDPDSFSRMDFINLDDIKQIEVTKGPGSIYASGSAGGTINIIPISVFDTTENRIKLGTGTYGSNKAHFKVGGKMGDKDFVSLTATYNLNENTWRNHNRYESTQSSLKYGHIFEDSSSVESEFSYTKVDFELPTPLTQSEFETYKKTGEVTATDYTWQNSARNSEILFFSTKYEKDFDSFTFAPKIFYNGWSHFHPVTGMINDSTGNHVFGTDLQINADHTLFGSEAKLVTGLTVRNDMSIGEKKYEYKDYTLIPFTTRIDYTTSDAKGDLAEESDSNTLIYGGYLLDTLTVNDKFKVDFSIRAEQADFKIDGYQYSEYSWSAGNYADVNESYKIDESFSLISSKIGMNYAVSDHANIYSNVAYADQIPTAGEMKTNVSYYSDGTAHLATAKSFNVELGYKLQQEKLSFEADVYYNPVQDFITAALDGWTTYYKNASKVDKLGSEMLLVYRPTKTVQIGTSYSFSEYKFTDYIEKGIDYSGNYLPHAPKHQYTLFAGYLPKNGFSLYIQSISWGKYYVDNANEAQYDGFDFVTNVTMGYKHKNHALKLLVNNLFDQHYSVATAYSSPDYTYTPAAPISASVNYTYTF